MDHCHYAGKQRDVAQRCSLKYSTGEFEGEFYYLGENKEKHKKPFLVPVTKEVKKINKNWKETTKTISYKLQFIDAARLMASLLLNLADNLAEEIHELQCKYGHNNKKLQTLSNKIQRLWVLSWIYKR